MKTIREIFPLARGLKTAAGAQRRIDRFRKANPLVCCDLDIRFAVLPLEDRYLPVCYVPEGKHFWVAHLCRAEIGVSNLPDLLSHVQAANLK